MGCQCLKTPPYLDIQELLHLVFRATHTLAPLNLIPTPLAYQQHPCQGAKTCQDKIQEEWRFEEYQLGDKGTLAFNAAVNATSGQTQYIDANVSDSSAFGSLKATSFGVSSNSHIGTPRFNSYSFGQPMSGSKGKESTTPLLKSSGFGKSTFGINQKRSRTASYVSTPDIDSKRLDGGEVQSICGMQTYQDISQEELRFEDYQLCDKGQKCGSSFSVSSTRGFGVIDNSRPFISPVFNQSTVDQPFYSHFPSTFAVERAEVDSLSNENSTPFPKSQKSISHIFLSNTSLLNSGGTGSRVESTASDVSFSPWIHSSPFAPFKPASSSSTTSTFSPLRNSWSLSTYAPLSPHSVSPFVSKTIRP